MAIIAERSSAIEYKNGQSPIAPISIKDLTHIKQAHSHIDDTWTWLEDEGLARHRHTTESMLNTMDEDAEVTYGASTSKRYKWLQENHPEIAQRILPRVKEGRWVLLGGNWVENDCANVNGNSHIMQMRLGQRLYHQMFGETAKVANNVDVFTHLPVAEIYAQAGIMAYLLYRPEVMEDVIPRISKWESESKKYVLLYHIPYDYNADIDNLERQNRIPAELADYDHPYLYVPYGPGNHGGILNKNILRRIGELQQDPTLPTLRHGTIFDYLDTLPDHSTLPVLKGQIGRHAPGTYSTVIKLTTLNREAEWQREEAYAAGFIAHQATGREVNVQRLTEADEEHAFIQMHDILPGTSLRDVYEQDAYPAIYHAINNRKKEIRDSDDRVVSKIYLTQAEGIKPIFARNPHSWTTASPTEIEVYDCLRPEEYHAKNSDGEEIPVQVIHSHAEVGWQKRILISPQVPSKGYEVVDLVPGKGKQEFRDMDATDEVIQNDRLTLAIDKHGYIKTLFDKEAHVSVFNGIAGIPMVYHDLSDTWGHGMPRFDIYKAGQFEATSVKLVENGPIRSIIQVDSEYGGSELTLFYMMHNDSNRIDIKGVLNAKSNMRKKAFKMFFPLNLIHTKATFEGPSPAIIERGQSMGEEVPLLNWMDLSGECKDVFVSYGMSFLSKGPSGANVFNPDRGKAQVGLTIGRFPQFAHHAPSPGESNRPEDFMNMGENIFGIALLPHRRNWVDAETPRHAAEFNLPPRLKIEDTVHPEGNLKKSDSFLQVSDNRVHVTTTKFAEDGSGDLILYCENKTKLPLTTTINLPSWSEREITMNFDKSELIILRVPKDPNQQSYITDIPELKGPPSPNAHIPSENGHVDLTEQL